MNPNDNKKILINKQLISKVTNTPMIFGDIKIKDNNLIYRYRYKCGGEITNGTEIININDFLQNCKLWAYEQGFEIKEEVDSVVVSKNKDIKLGCFDSRTTDTFIPYDRNRLITAFNNLSEYIKRGAYCQDIYLKKQIRV